MLPMNPKEFEKWTEVRKQGGNKYSIKTSLAATTIGFLLFFIAGIYNNQSVVDKYLAGQMAVLDKYLITFIIASVALFIASKILFAFNEKRYSATQNKN